MPTPPAPPRFLTLQQVADELNVSHAQVYALVRDRSLVAVKIGGRGQWRVEASQLEDYIARMYAQTRDFVDSHPFVDPEGQEIDSPDKPGD